MVRCSFWRAGQANPYIADDDRYGLYIPMVAQVGGCGYGIFTGFRLLVGGGRCGWVVAGRLLLYGIICELNSLQLLLYHMFY